MNRRFTSRSVLPLAAALALGACEQATESPVAPEPSLAVVGGDAGADITPTYIVVTRGETLPEGFAADVKNLGGTILNELPQIGVAFVQSDDDRFAQKMGRHREVQAVAPDLMIEFDDPSAEDLSLIHI